MVNLATPAQPDPDFEFDELWSRFSAQPPDVSPSSQLCKIYERQCERFGFLQTPSSERDLEQSHSLVKAFKDDISRVRSEAAWERVQVFTHDPRVSHLGRRSTCSILAEIRDDFGNSIAPGGASFQRFTTGPVFLRVMTSHDPGYPYVYEAIYSKNAFKEELRGLRANVLDGRWDASSDDLLFTRMMRAVGDQFPGLDLSTRDINAVVLVRHNDAVKFLFNTAAGRCFVEPYWDLCSGAVEVLVSRAER